MTTFDIQLTRRLLLLTILLISFSYTICAQDISGYWEGVLIQENGTPIDTFYYAMCIDQNDSTITGTTTIRISDDPIYYAIFDMTGEIMDTTLSFNEEEVLEGNSGAWFWCLKSGDLELNDSLNQMSGPWQAPGCNPGTIILNKVTTLMPLTIIYVDSSASGANTGATWTDAFNDLNDALLIADSGDTIFVAKGHYYTSTGFYIEEDSLLLMGGFHSGGGDTSLPSDHPTILSGDAGIINDSSDNALHVLTVQATAEANHINGLSITDGNAVDQGGVVGGLGGGLLVIGELTLSNARIRDNYSDYTGAVFEWGNASSLRLFNCTINQNSSGEGVILSHDNGAALYIGEGTTIGN